MSRFWETRFPSILASCQAHGIDPSVDLIPVAPACHYASGGVRTDLWGRSSVPGLYATGEVACSGVHGANRLASNSLLEGLVFSRRIAEVLPGELRPYADLAPETRPSALVPGDRLGDLQQIMSSKVGVLRNHDGLREVLEGLPDLLDADAPVNLASWEATNLVTVASALTAAALGREETRGSHWREDFGVRDDADWSGHFDAVTLEGVTRVRFSPAAPTDLGLEEEAV